MGGCARRRGGGSYMASTARVIMKNPELPLRTSALATVACTYPPIRDRGRAAATRFE